ncbi:hypothetical protein [Paenibacillus dendritiformis]|uniref:hypothetical protein n=1 Tax=Paenibacillus dendritiformis TaxID=130049 RepID=UPI000DAA1229|nr:hypothetical protein [Paenibacillus dendritiformis]PZM63724.1 hypothetical protein DOE73_20575 [Paenibacillus dendritiformis]
MKTVKLHLVQTPANDPFTRDTFVLSESGFNTTEFSYVNEVEEYILPEGYSIGKTEGGENAIFDDKYNYCILDRYNKCPRLSSASGVVFLRKLER